MSQITFRVDYPQSFARGVDCPQPPLVTIDVDPSTLASVDRESLAARLNGSGDVCSVDQEGYWHCGNTRYPRRDYGPPDRNGDCRPPLVCAATPRVEDLLAAIRAEDDCIVRHAAAVRAKQDAADQAARAELAAWLARDDDSLVSVQRYSTYHGELRQGWYPAVNTADWTGPNRPTLIDDPAAREKMARVDAIVRERNRVKVAEIVAEREAAARERADWIHQRGSARLKRLAAEGIDHDKTYRAERDTYEREQFAAFLATDRPGWTAVTEAELDRDIRDVSSRTLALLDAARQTAPTAALAKLKASGKYVCVEEFRGKLIYWPRD